MQLGMSSEATSASSFLPSLVGNAAGGFIPSFPASEQMTCGPVVPVVKEEASEGLSSDWPVLAPAVYHGLLGEMLRAVEQQTESDPAAVLLGWLACLGTAAGRGAWTLVGPDRHHPALFVGIVGSTSSQKGMAWAVGRWPFARADPEWAERCLCNGVGSGQGLVERVRDESRNQKLNPKTGRVEEVVTAGAADKRCLLRLDELAVCFKLQRSDTSTLGETLLTAWGGEPLEVPNRSGNDLRATGYSIGVLGDTQPGTLRKLLASGAGPRPRTGG